MIKNIIRIIKGDVLNTYECDFEINGIDYLAQLITSATPLSIQGIGKECNIYEVVNANAFSISKLEHRFTFKINFNNSINTLGSEQFYKYAVDDAIKEFKESNISPKLTDTDMYVVEMIEKTNDHGEYIVGNIEKYVGKLLEQDDKSKEMVQINGENVTLKYCNLREKVLGLKKKNDYTHRYFVGKTHEEVYVAFESYCKMRMERLDSIMDSANESHNSYYKAFIDAKYKWN